MKIVKNQKSVYEMAQEEYVKGLAYEGNKLSKDNSMAINYFASKTGFNIPNQDEASETTYFGEGETMFEQIKNYINSGLYDLNGLLDKINVLWLAGRLTDEEQKALIELARNNANPENSYVPLQKQIDQLFEAQKEMDSKLTIILEKMNKIIEGEEVEPEPLPDVDPEEYPPYKAPTGAHDAYYKDDKMTYTDGKKYICVAPEGIACVWGPDTYPSYWKLVEGESNE